MSPALPGPSGRWPAIARPLPQWSLLLALSLALSLMFERLQLPAALLLGPMLAAIVLAGASPAGAGIAVPRWPYLLAQGVIGCLIARSITPPMLLETLRQGPLFLGVIAAVLAISFTLGWLLARGRVLPGASAVLGSSPGAASAMVVIAESCGADPRLVAFMQYLRVVLVVLVASAVARLWLPAGAEGTAAALPWFPVLDGGRFGATLALAVGGPLLARRFKIPSGALLLPLAGGAVLEGSGLLTLELPPWLLAFSYALIGWAIGLRFTRPILGHVARILPRVLASTLVLIGLCGALAAGLTLALGIDPLTAYLATSPGGADSVAIIAASAGSVDLSFVIALQTSRFLVVLLLGPRVARWVARRTG